MANRASILIGALLACSVMVRAQSVGYQQVDSVSYAQYQAAQWKELIAYGNSAVAGHVDYPLLRLRIAYAQFVIGNYSGALLNYEKVLSEDSHNQMAMYYSYLCCKYLNRDLEAGYHASYVDTFTLNRDQIKPYAALEAGFETSVKTSNNANRGTGIYNRASLSNRLGFRIQLDQSVAYFTQSISSNTPVFIPGSTLAVNSFTSNDSQLEYYAKLRFAVSNQISLIGAYHYMSTSFASTTNSSNIGLLGVKYSHPYFSLQADVNTAQVINTSFQQYNGELAIYPLGNLNLYTVSRGSVQANGLQQTVFSQTIGFKAAKKLWLEAAAGFGKMDNYLDNDALYVYNAIDITQNRAGGTAFYSFGRHIVAYLNYTYEKKQDYYLNTNYNQNSMTGGFTWKF